MTKTQKAEINGLLRQIIGKRDREACVRCGSQQRLQMSHIYPKGRYRRMEFDECNIKLLCAACHLFWWHKNPIEAHEWLHRALPKERLDRLKMLARDATPQRFDPKLHILYLKNVLKKMGE